MSDGKRNYSEGLGPQRNQSEQDPPVELPPPVPEETSLGQVLGGAKNMASRAQNYYDNTVTPAFERSGAKEFYESKVVPTTRNVTRSVKQTATDQHTRLTSTPISRAAIVLLIVALVATFSTFLPMGPTSFGRYGSAARNVVDGNFEGIGSLALVQAVGIVTAFIAATIFRLLLFVTIIVSIVAIAWRSTRVKKIAGISGVSTGVLGVLIGVAALLVTGRLDNVPVGVGTIFLLISSIVVAVTALFLLRSSKTLGVLPPVPPQVPQAR